MAHDKRLAAGYKGFDRTKNFPLADAIALVKRNATAKFDETVEISTVSSNLAFAFCFTSAIASASGRLLLRSKVL